MASDRSDRGGADGAERRIEELERTLQAVREDSEIAQVLLGLSAALADVSTVEATLDKAVNIVPELFGSRRCFSARRDDLSNRFTLSACAGYDDDQLAVLADLAARPGGLPVMAQAMRERGPVLVSDAAIAPTTLSEENVHRRRLGAYIVIPLIRGSEDFGCLGIEFDESREFSSKDVALARGIARQFGVALANARRINLLQKLRSSGGRLGSGWRVADVLQDVADAGAELLSADAALVYFLDPERKLLVSAAGRGIKPAATHILSQIDVSVAPLDDLLRDKIVAMWDLPEVFGSNEVPAAAVAAPIPGEGEAQIGALLVFADRSFDLGADEEDALRVLTVQSSTAIRNAQRFERQRRVARSLQEGLLSIDVPAMEGCEVGAIYEAATDEAEIGGDYFDVFELPGGRVGLVVGDVSGKGAEAAALTAQAKYTLRAFATRDPAPASVLYHLNNALAHEFGVDRFTTVVYALFDPETLAVDIALAGHPPPLLFRHATKSVEPVILEGTILGAFEEEAFDQKSVQLGPGDVFVAYTDGLIEARSGGDLYGADRVVEALLELAPGRPARDIAQSLYDRAKAFGAVSDDTIVLAFACSPKAAE